MVKTLMISLCVVVMTGCAANVVTDYDSGVAFGDYSSWEFAPAKGNADDYVSLDGSRIRNAIEREMNLKAMRKVPADEAGLLVAWEIVTEERLERQGPTFGFGFGSRNFGWGLSTPPPIERVKEGKLVVELVDPENKRVVWRSASRRYLNEQQSTGMRSELIDEIVADMFEKYPPGV